jgi:hypothetical protein
LLKQEFFTTPKQANFYLVDGSMITVDLPPNSLAFTFCQVPIIYILSNNTKIEVVSSDVKVELPDTNVLPENFTRSIINRIGEISLIKVYIAESGLLA